ncbi:hypothetical protein Acsp04_53720 [Actinomadura sp. NBRC 104425]|uniref:hypothetical protein n=1 Tax=Actinomadura sp. NBRC 104425 TaxID=3032204 RepID=UPI0024A2587C|nr:hypothetical protein [Actinomadura sp. NBRC 104425]GLZ15137.1 hypothetical protein Acsp04_53720 [Actinomadura sp. NBRC 104425]
MSSGSLRELSANPIGLAVYGLFGGCIVGTLTVLIGQITGLLPLGEPRTLRVPCRDASLTALVPGGEVWNRTGHTGAECEMRARPPRHAHLEIKIKKAWTAGMARDDHLRGCGSLNGLGAVGRPPGLGDEACVVTDRGMLPETTVLVRRGALRITVRYGSAAKTAAAVESEAVAAARHVTASL